MTKEQKTSSPIGEVDLHLFNEGNHRYLHRTLGAQPAATGTWFSVWAPVAAAVSVVGDMTGWDGEQALTPVGSSGLWSGFVEGATAGQSYRYAVTSRHGERVEKADPLAAANNEPPSTASIIAEMGHDWGDAEWMAKRTGQLGVDAPISIYEVHLGSWGRHVTEGQRFPRYDQLADPIADHVVAHGFTHVELLPVMEHPYYGSWGYQTTGYFAPTARYGSPRQLMAMIDRLHQRGIGVILDWVPSHFPMDAHGLARFDGTHLYEHADPRKGYHPDWTSAIFNYGRPEVRSFLVSSAISWLDRYHVDGLRVDAVASMLYLDYSRRAGEWIPNEQGGRENLEAIAFLRQLNDAVHEEFPDAATFAEESTAWPRVTGPSDEGGLGFDFKWDMGWMHDTLTYLQRDPVHRRFHHDEITFRSVYAFSERFVLPLSHDEVVHGKGSLLRKMPGDEWQRFANLRLLFALMWSQPGKKLLFMGGELAAPTEWAHEGTIDWERLHDAPGHGGVRRLVADLNALYAAEPALHAGDAEPSAFRMIVGDDDTHSVFAWVREDPSGTGGPILTVLNATPTVHHGYRIGVPVAGRWDELLNTDAADYGGSGQGNIGAVETEPQTWHGYEHSLPLTLPALAAVFLRPARDTADDAPEPATGAPPPPRPRRG
jgi:1,4-alpha-glucan branching enzyme